MIQDSPRVPWYSFIQCIPETCSWSQDSWGGSWEWGTNFYLVREFYKPGCVPGILRIYWSNPAKNLPNWAEAGLLTPSRRNLAQIIELHLVVVQPHVFSNRFGIPTYPTLYIGSGHPNQPQWFWCPYRVALPGLG